MANGDNDFRRPSLEPAKQNTTMVDTPSSSDIAAKEDKKERKRGQGLSKQEVIIQAANQGGIDLGQPGQGLTKQQVYNRATVRAAAQSISSENLREMSKKMNQDLRQDDTLAYKAYQAASNFSAELTKVIPGAMKFKAHVYAGMHNLLADEKNDIKAAYLPSYRAGEKVAEDLKEIFPTNPIYREEFWAGTVPKMTARFIPQVMAALGSGGSTAIAVGASALHNATLSHEYYDQAKAEGASDEEAFSNMMVNLAGTTALEGLTAARFVRVIDKSTGGVWKKFAGKLATEESIEGGFKSLMKQGFKGSVTEGSQEAIQQMYENASAQAIYDSHRNLMDNVYKAFGAGALMGTVADMSLKALLRKKTFAETWEERIAAGTAAIDLVENNHDVMTLLDAESKQDAINAVQNLVFGTGSEQKMIITKPKATSEGILSPTVENTVYSNKKWKDLWIKWLKTGGRETKGVAVERERMQAQIDKELEKAKLNLERLNTTILEHYDSDHKTVIDAVKDKSDSVPSNLTKEIDKKLRGKKAALPQEIESDVQRIRDHIDAMSIKMMTTLDIQGKLKQSFLKGIGHYIHRDYRAFQQDVEWTKDHVPDDIWQKAIVFMRNKIRSDLRQKQIKENDDLTALERMQRLRDPSIADQQINISEEELTRRSEKALQEMLRARDPKSLYKYFEDKEFTKDRGDMNLLKKKLKVPKIIRQVLGEYTQPDVNYMNTISKMAETVHKRQFFDTIADRFEGELFFKDLDDVAKAGEDQDNYIKGVDTGVGSKLENVYMHQMMFDALKAKEEPQEASYPKLMRVVAAAKYSKTVLSHVAHIRNVVGGTAFLGFNGHMFNRADRDASWKRATQVFNSYKDLNKKELEEQWLKYVELGLTGGSVRAGELSDMLSDADFSVEGFMSNNFNHSNADKDGMSAYKKSKSWFKKFSRKATNLYKAEDAFLRVWMYELEKARLQSADPNITDQQVADLVNDLYPNYDRVNETIKNLRKNIVLAPFISFPAEVVRTSINTARRAKVEIQSDNEALKKIGWQRIAGMSTTMSMFTAAGAASMAMLNISDEEDEAYRQFMPPWSKHSSIIYFDKGNGKVGYFNTSFTNPYEFIQDPLFALLAGDEDRTVMERVGQASWEFIKPVVNVELATKAVADIAYNRDSSTDSEIWNPEDPLGTKAQKAFLHAWEAFEPGTISSARRLGKSMFDGDSDREVSNELAGFIGARASTINVRKSYGFKIRDFRERIRNVRRRYNSVKYDETQSTQAEFEALQASNETYREIHEEMVETTRAAQRTGVYWDELEKIMEESGLASRDIQAIRSGNFQPFER